MRGSAMKEQLSEEEIKIRAKTLTARLRATKRNLDDVLRSLGQDSSYYMVCIVLNSLLFAVFDHLNQRDQFLRYEDVDFEFSDEHGRIFEAEHPSVIDSKGRFRTNNGAVRLETLTVLTNVSAILGCVAAFLSARWPLRRTVAVFSTGIVGSFLLSHAFFFPFVDRFSFVAGASLAKAISLMTLQAAFEAAPGKLRVLAVAISHYLGYLVVFVTIMLFKKSSHDDAETQFMLIIAALTVLYALMCPDQLVRSIVRKDPERVRRILERFSPEQCSHEDAIVDDVLFAGPVPRNAIDAVLRLLRVKPFRSKFLALSVLITLQTRLNSGEHEFIKTMLPFSPLEAIFFSRIAGLLASLLVVLFIVKMDRRSLLLFLLSFNLVVSLCQSLIPIDSFSFCFEAERPGEVWTVPLVGVFISLTMLRVSTGILLRLMALEHIPALYRAYFFPLVFLIDAVFSSLSDTLPVSQIDIYDTPFFVRPTIRYSIVSLFVAAMCIDDSEFMAMSTEDVPCYHTKRPKRSEKTGRTKAEFEEQFRILCENKAVEKELHRQQTEKQKEDRTAATRLYFVTQQHEENDKELVKENEAKRNKIRASAEERWERRDEDLKKLLRKLQNNRLI